MKRSWLGFGLLIVLLVIAIASTLAMVCIHEPIEEHLEHAAQWAIQGDWENAGYSLERAWNQWNKWAHFRSALADHTPVEDIDSEFALLEVYYLTQEDAAFAAQSRSLAKKVAAVGEAHELVWWNLL